MGAVDDDGCHAAHCLQWRALLSARFEYRAADVRDADGMRRWMPLSRRSI